jgi:hypothetical protein
MKEKKVGMAPEEREKIYGKRKVSKSVRGCIKNPVGKSYRRQRRS